MSYVVFTLIFLSIFSLVYSILKIKGISHWIGPYYVRKFKKGFCAQKYPLNIYFCLVDHFEPVYDPIPPIDVVDLWCRRLPEIAEKHKDSRGQFPKHSFFIPIEMYNAKTCDQLADLCSKGYGDVEIHLHHDNDTPENLKNTLLKFKEIFHNKHGLLRKDPVTGEIIYAFIHGNWCLDNSRSDGRWCGVNNEIDILLETGCYADFTMPSRSGSTQTKTVNSIYYAIDDPQKPKSHDYGIPMEIGKAAPENALLMIQGPLALNWSERKYGFLPKIEDGDVSANNPPTEKRIDLWIKQGIRPEGCNNSIVVKVHTHGATTRNTKYLLNGHLEMMYSYLGEKYNDGKKYNLFYVTPYELYSVLKKIEDVKEMG